jgi:signal transduction histidine kinase
MTKKRVLEAGASRCVFTDDVQQVLTQLILEFELQGLRRTKPLVGRMLNEVKMSLSVQDSEMHVLWANETSQKMTGFCTEKAKGKFCWEGYHQFHNIKKPCFDCVAMFALAEGKKKLGNHDFTPTQKSGEMLLPIKGEIQRVEINASALLSFDKEKVVAVIEATQLVTDRWEAAVAADDRLVEVLTMVWKLTSHQCGAPNCKSIALYYRPTGQETLYRFAAVGDTDQMPSILRPGSVPDDFKRILNSNGCEVIPSLQPEAELHRFLMAGILQNESSGNVLINATWADSKSSDLFLKDLLPYWNYVFKAFDEAHQTREKDFIGRSHNLVEEFLEQVADSASQQKLKSDTLIKLAMGQIKTVLSPMSMHFRVLNRKTNSLEMKQGYGLYHTIAPKQRPLGQKAEPHCSSSVNAVVKRAESIVREVLGPERDRILSSVGKETTQTEQDELARIASHLTLPLIIGKRVFGTMSIQFEDDTLCYKGKEEFLLAFARALSNALALVDWSNEPKILARDLRTLDSMMFEPPPQCGPLSQEQKMEQSAVEMAFNITNADCVVFYDHVPDFKEFKVMYYARPGQDEARSAMPGSVPDHFGLFGAAFTSRQVQNSQDYSHDQWRALHSSNDKPIGLASFFDSIKELIVVPVFVDGIVVGVLAAASWLTGWLTKDDEAVLAEFGFKIGLCLQAMRTKRQLAEQYKTTDAINKIYAAMGRTTDDNILIRQFLLAVTTGECLAFPRAVLFTKDASRSGLFSCVYAIGSENAQIAQQNWERAGNLTLDQMLELISENEPQVQEGELLARKKDLRLYMDSEVQILGLFKKEQIAHRRQGSPHLIQDARLRSVLYPGDLDTISYMLLPLCSDSDLIGILLVDQAFLFKTGIEESVERSLTFMVRDFAFRLQALRHSATIHVARGLAYSLRTRTALLESALSRLKSRVDTTYLKEVARMEDSVRFFKRGAMLATKTLRLDEHGAFPPSTCDLNEVAQTLCSHLSDDRIELSQSAGPLIVSGERNRIEDILMELIINAQDFAPRDGGKIRVTVATGDLLGRVTIKDNGPGVHPAVRPQLFEMFNCYPASRMGLGLYYARTLARAFGGDVLEAPQQRPGACFVLSLAIKNS